jgi:hypothetical protein
MSKVQKELEDISAGIGQIRTMHYIWILPRIWRQSLRGLLWPRLIELGLIIEIFNWKLSSPHLGE